MEALNLNNCAGDDAKKMFNITEERFEELNPKTQRVIEVFSTGAITEAELTVSLINLGKTEEERLFMCFQAAGASVLKLLGHL